MHGYTHSATYPTNKTNTYTHIIYISGSISLFRYLLYSCFEKGCLTNREKPSDNVESYYGESP